MRRFHEHDISFSQELVEDAQRLVRRSDTSSDGACTRGNPRLVAHHHHGCEAQGPPQPAGIECLHFGSFSLAVEPAATTLARLMRRETGARVISLDPNVRPTLVGERTAYVERLEALVRLATVVKVSAADLDWLYPGEPAATVAARWRESGPAVVAVTEGERGAFALAGTVRAEAAGASVEVVDTVGAGDTFQAGLLVRLAELGRLSHDGLAALNEAELADALAFAGRAAAITCTRPGADPPRRAEL